MEITYMVSGNNLFGQWFLKSPILEKFQTVKSEHSHILLDDFNLKYAELVCICWSYNIFKFEQEFYVTGDWAGDEKVITKINISEEYDASDLLFVGNDFNLLIIDTKKLKMWTLTLAGKINKTLLELNFEVLVTQKCIKKQRKDPQIVKAVATNTSFLYLTNEGYVYQGMSPSHLDTSHCIGQVCDIDCGYNHFMILTDVGRIYTWGSSERLQLGHGELESIDTPTEVEALAGLKITKIAAGGLHSLAISEYGDLYGWGWNDTGQLGITTKSTSNVSADANKSYLLPTLIDVFDEKGTQVELDVVDIACGSRHSVIKLADKTIWASGYNKYGQLGFSPETHPTTETFKKAFDCDFEYKLSCGIWTTVLVRTKTVG